jgi:hypothetical protein
MKLTTISGKGRSKNGAHGMRYLEGSELAMGRVRPIGGPDRH